YRGSSPLSRLYIAPSSDVASMLEAVEKCIDSGAVIINYSAGEYFSDGRYDSFDRFVDTLIYNVRFLFTVSAGNSKYVSSPGTCMNGITVGNAATKINGYTSAERPYDMFFVSEDDCSAYEQDETLPSKPDIAAPGTYIHYIDASGNIDFSRYGTSFSAPYVSAVAAQLVQKYPEAGTNPALLKALVLCGADGDGISTVGNPQNGERNILRLKSGAGLLDSTAALEIKGRLGGSIGNTEKEKREIFLQTGQSIRAVLCYLRNPDISAVSPSKENIVLKIISPDNVTDSVSDDERENVKIINYTADFSGTYSLYFEVLSSGNFDSVTYGIAWRVY
ncbi:MAG: S8 family serine peptidase, partial [Clostridia bacterium]|nr:S8 family serine peptidase [Clostridia bacterium]